MLFSWPFLRPSRSFQIFDLCTTSASEMQGEGEREVAMTAFQTILVAIDRSTFARVVLDHAAHFARAFDADLVILHVAEIPPVLPIPEEGALGRDPWFDARAMRETAREEIIGRIAETSVSALCPEVILRSGLPGEEIALEAKERGADLVIIGTHGRSGLSRFLLGSVAEKVGIDAPCPVLTVRGDDKSEAPIDPPRRILIPVDLSPRSLDALPAALEVAKRFGAETALLAVLEDPLQHPEIVWQERAGITPEEVKAHCAAETRRILRTELEARGLASPLPRLEIGYGPPARTIVERASAEGYDLIALASRGRGSWVGTILGSVARGVVRGAPCPVLTLR